MKSLLRSSASAATPLPVFFFVTLSALLFWPSPNAKAQTFIGTNSPGQGTNYTFSTTAAATNLSLVISNSAGAYSYLMLKKGGTPTDTDFDFVARVSGQTNEINLELPEFAVTNYGLRVSTPGSSATHNFRVLYTTNRTDMRSAPYPVLKPVV